MRVLAVRQPWASLIVEGLKTIEVRSRPTNIRERVCIYASTAKQETLEGEYGKYYNYMILPTGKIVGTVELHSSTHHPIISTSVFNMHRDLHLAPERYFNENGVHFWHLRNPIKFTQPIPYKPPKGAIVWSNFELPEAI